MASILHIISSPRKDASVSIKLGKAIVEKLQAKYPDSTVTEVNLLEEKAPHLDPSHLQSFFTPKDQHTDADKEAIRFSDKSISQIFAADYIVIGTPLYNFSIPSVLKAWIDHIARAGVTFKYTEQGPEGLVKGKKVYIAFAAGAVYSEGPYKAYDFATGYLTALFGFIGMTDVTVFRAEGVSLPNMREQALAKAIESIVV